MADTLKVSAMGLLPKQLGICSMLQLYGSVLPRCMIWAAFGGVTGGLMEGFGWHVVQYGTVWRHPYALHVFGMVLGFSLVMRIQIAYQRFWEAATHCHTAAAKWADACMQVMTFDEISKDAWSQEALEVRVSLVAASSCHAIPSTVSRSCAVPLANPALHVAHARVCDG